MRAGNVVEDRTVDYLQQVQDRVRRFAAPHRTAVRVAGAGTLFLSAMLIAEVQNRATPTATVFVTSALVSASFVIVPAARWPSWLTVAAATAGSIALIPAGVPEAGRPALVFAMLLYSLRSERTAVLAATVVAVAVLTLVGVLVAGMGGRVELSNLVALSWVLAAAAVGQAVRARRAQREMLVERARRAEQGREEEARRRVQAERLRIARELHDAVGHHVALISVQAGAMNFLLDTEPAKARESLAHIQNASGAALEELRLAVGLLRQPGDHEPVEPAGRLDRLDELIASFVATGLRVTCDITGPARALPEAVDLTTFRLIQESLTNTAKHASGASAAIRIAYRPGTLALAIEDDGPPTGNSLRTRSAPGEAGTAGHGILGMHERAAALGGWLSAGPLREGGFRVEAELPTSVSPVAGETTS